MLEIDKFGNLLHNGKATVYALLKDKGNVYKVIHPVVDEDGMKIWWSLEEKLPHSHYDFFGTEKDGEYPNRSQLERDMIDKGFLTAD